MAIVKRKDLEAALLRKGFRRASNHHNHFWFYYRGRKTRIKTFTSHGKREYDDWLLTQVKKQLRVTKNQLMDLIKCPMSEEEYTQHLIDMGHLQG